MRSREGPGLAISIGKRMAVCLLGFVWAGIGFAGQGEEPPIRPNIVFIMADDLGYGDLGSYGQRQIRTPNLDLLAQQGTRFTQVYAGATVCAPSRSALMTGLHGGHTRVKDNIPLNIALQPDDVTVAEVLRQAGYRTGAIGKWSLGSPGSWGIANYQGFDYWYGHLNQDQAHFYYPDYLWENERVVLLPKNRAGKRGTYTTDLFTEKALQFIRDNQQRPFFLYLAYTLPHWSDYDKDSALSHVVPTDQPYSDEQWPQVEKNYAAMVSRLDADVGKVLQLLGDLGIEENTLVFFTSDNGPSAETVHDPEFFDSNGPLRGVKRDVYEGGIRVPMLVRWPGRVLAGRVSDFVWAFWDFLPTAAELAGLPVPKQTDGISVLPTLLGRNQPGHEYLYWDYGHVRPVFKQAARWRNWKGVRNGVSSPIELYDLEADIGETRDLAAEHPDVVDRIRRIFQEARGEDPRYPVPGLSPQPARERP